MVGDGGRTVADEPATPSLWARLIVVVSLGTLALALSDSVFHWVLFTDALIRRVLF